MSNAFQSAGSQGRKQTSAAPIFVNEMFTGYYTQRNPLRDPGTAYLVQKFYAGNRFDALIDGLNIEISNRLTIKRRCGASVYNSATFPAINRFYEFRRTVNNTDSIIVMADTASNVYNATGPSTKTSILTKSAGSGQSNMLGVGTTLYIGDGIDLKKWMQPGGWTKNTSLATTTLAIGSSIIDSNGALQYLTAVTVGTCTNVALSAHIVTLTFSSTTLQVDMSFSMSGLSSATFLNGVTLVALSVVGLTVTACFVHANYASAGDSGTATTTDIQTPATTGSSAPAWNVTPGGTTTDGISTWTNYDSPVYPWGTPLAPVQAPSLSQAPNATGFFWQPSTGSYGGGFIMDNTGGVQQSFNPTGASTGSILPTFSQLGAVGFPTGASEIQDASMSWVFCGKITDAWQAALVVPAPGVAGGYVIVDSNGNLQQVSVGGTTGGTVPTWNQTVGGTTADNTVTWTNRGAVLGLAFTGWKYGYAFHAVDGSVSTLSPLSPLTNGVLGGVTVKGTGTADAQIDSIWIYRTADGGSTPFYLASIPNPGATAWTYVDQNRDSVLNEFVIANQFLTGNPPPQGFLPDCYHLGRIFGHVGNTVSWSAGADSQYNGNTAFPPANNFVMPSLVNRIVPLTIGMLIFTTSEVFFSGIAGVNRDIPSQPAPWMQGKVGGLLSRNALDIVGSTIYLVNSKAMCKAIDIAAGESEVGFPIGDVLANGSSPIAAMNPSTCYVAYHEQNSTDCGLYLASPGSNTTNFWYRANTTPSPDQGVAWSPPAVSAVGYSAVQSIETSPGIHQLLEGPHSSGPILYRDPTTFADNETPYSAYGIVGSVVLAAPGQCALLYFIGTDCTKIGSRIAVSVLMNEIGGNASFASYGSLVSVYTPDPPQLGPAESNTIYNDRWWMGSTQEPAWCRHLQIKFQWPAENAGNELLTYTLFGEHYQEL